jgi:hypothetical protein
MGHVVYLPLTFSRKLATVCLIISFQGACRSCSRLRRLSNFATDFPIKSGLIFALFLLKLDGRNHVFASCNHVEEWRNPPQ